MLPFLKVVIVHVRVTALVLAAAHAYLAAVHPAVTLVKGLAAILAIMAAVVHVMDAKEFDKMGSEILFTPHLAF